MIWIHAAILSAALIATPGPIDRNGGHLDFQGNYHIHAGPSYQFRYVDATGRIWEGQGPRPEENLRNFSDDFLWQSAFIPFIVITSILAFVMYYRAEKWVKRFVRSRHYAHVIMHQRHEMLAQHAPSFVLAPLPSLNLVAMAGRRALTERRTRIRRAVYRSLADRRQQQSKLKAI